MLTVKKGKVELSVARTTLVSNVSMCLSFKVDVCGHGLASVCGKAHCDELPKGWEMAAMGHSLYLAVENALRGDPLAAKKSKVGTVACGAHNGHFQLAWTTKGNNSAVGVSLKAALKALKPGKLYSTYVNCVRAAGGKPNRDDFNAAAKKFADGINAGVSCCVVGAIKPNKEALQKKVDAAAKQLDTGKITGKTGSVSKCDSNHSDTTLLKVKGWQAYATADYIRTKVPGLCVCLARDGVAICTDKSKWSSVSKKIKKQAKKYIESRYSKVKGDLKLVLAYLASCNAELPCADVKALMSGSVDAKKVAEAVVKNL